MFSSDYFHSLAFGLPALVIVGCSWSLTGIVCGSAPKHGLRMSDVQRLSTLCGISIAIIIMAATGISYQAIDLKTLVLTCSSYFAASILNTFMLQVMSLAMQRGPNGIIWCIIQSALICTFLVGVTFFGVRSGCVQWLGIAMILTALVFFGLSRDNSNSIQQEGKLNWKTLAFMAFCLVGCQQNLSTLPSYFQEAQKVSSVMRTLSTQLGVVVGIILWSFLAKEKQIFFFNRESLRNKYLWIYVGLMQSFSLVTSYLLLYPAMDILANHKLGGMSYPLMCGSCIVCFSIICALALKERFTWKQIAGIVICVIGMILMCLK